MEYRRSLREELRSNRVLFESKRAVVGFDGFVDTIVTPVGLRHGLADQFTPVPTIADFGHRILGAVGKNTNIEFYPRIEKLGGNGPIMATALLAAGTAVTYIGALGTPVHPVFCQLASKARVHSLCDPASTVAVEFHDGKVMFGTMRSLDEITFERICESMGPEGFPSALADADLVALVNWTMIPHMTAVFRKLAIHVLSRLPRRDRTFFFDLADPEKRTEDDLREALAAISYFENFGRVALGLNLKEAQQVHRTLAFRQVGDDETAMRQMCSDIRLRLGLSVVVVHSKKSAACATVVGSWCEQGPYTAHPLIATGAGDHFNAGFCLGLLAGLEPTMWLQLGMCTGGFYVRTGRSPSLGDLDGFLAEEMDAQGAQHSSASNDHPVNEKA